MILLGVPNQGCFQRKGIHTDRLIHNDRARDVSSHVWLDQETIRRNLRVLVDRKRSGATKVSDRRTVEALRDLSFWYPEKQAPSPEECFPRIDLIVALFDDPSEDVRYQAVETVGRVGCPDIEPDLLYLRERDPSPLVREAARLALFRLGLGDEVWAE